MGKIIESKIDRFDKGITNDPRIDDFSYAQLIKNFDAHTFPKKLVPFRSSESADGAAATSQKQAFAIALRSGTTYNLFSLGVQSGTAKAEILMKTLSTGGSADLGDTGWTTPNNNQSSGGATSFNLFVYYKKRGRIFGAEGGNTIWSFDPSSVAAFSDESHSLSYTNIAQGLVHSKDDILYIPYDNKIAKNNNNSWTDAALTLPSHFYITSICEYGNYLAIACAPLAGFGRSVVYLWDRDATLTTLSESVDWGGGVLKILEEVDGYLVGISFVGGSSTNFKAKVVCRYYAGGKPIIFRELVSEAAVASSAAGDLPIFKQKINNALYFLMVITINGTRVGGVWKIKYTPSGFSLVMDRSANNDTAWGASDTLLGFFIVEDFLFLSYNQSAIYYLDKTDDQANYNITAIYESLKYNAGDTSLTKKLLGVSVMTEALPSGGQVVLKYKKDEETSWTTIFTNTTVNSLSYSAISIESSAATLPEYKEIAFRIESSGNATITGLGFQSEIIGKRVYE